MYDTEPWKATPSTARNSFVQWGDKWANIRWQNLSISCPVNARCQAGKCRKKSLFRKQFFRFSIEQHWHADILQQKEPFLYFCVDSKAPILLKVLWLILQAGLQLERVSPSRMRFITMRTLVLSSRTGQITTNMTDIFILKTVIYLRRSRWKRM